MSAIVPGDVVYLRATGAGLKADRPALVLCFYGLVACCVASVFVAVFS